MKKISCLLLVALSLISETQAKIKLPYIFADHAVLQTEQPVPVWGTADPGEKVTVEFAGQSKTASADAQGNWRVKLDAMPASAEPRTMRVKGSGDEVKFNDLLVGEVWLCSGQSNMFMPLGKGPWSSGATGGEAEIALPEQPELRLFCWEGKNECWKDAGLTGWQRANSKSRAPFSATAYFFARSIQAELKVPVGVINISIGGTAITPWTPREAALKVPIVEHYNEIYLKNKTQFDAELARKWRYVAILQKRTANPAAAIGPAPIPPADADYTTTMIDQVANFGLYEEFIAPIVPYALRGVIWYQGEANAGNVELGVHYEEMLRTLIASWREAWGAPRMPFYFVQLPCWENNDYAKYWHVNRQSMLNVLRSTPDVGMAVTADLGDIHELHPPTKRPVGERLSLWALAKAYGKKIVYSGPLVSRVTGEGDKLRITFDTCGSALKIQGPAWADLEVAGEDGIYYPATATISDTEAVVGSLSVPKPLAVRYGWKTVFTPTLFNREGLPASPFSLPVTAPEK
jgi:sialate O-acetylesterase